MTITETSSFDLTEEPFVFHLTESGARGPVGPGGLGITTHPLSTYTNLMALATAGGLVVGDKYQMTYQAKFIIPGWTGPQVGDPYPDGICTGEAETLTLTAKTTSSFELEASSSQYPNDIIHWVPANNLFYTRGFQGHLSQTGSIIRRHWLTRKINCDYDWRAALCRVYRTQDTGQYSSHDDFSVGYQDIPFIPYSCRLEVGAEPTITGASISVIANENPLINDQILDSDDRFVSAGFMVGQTVYVTATDTMGVVYGATILSVSPGVLGIDPNSVSGGSSSPDAMRKAVGKLGHPTGEITHLTHHDARSGEYEWPWAVLQKSGYRAQWGEGNNWVCMTENAWATDWPCCTQGELEGETQTYSGSTGGGIRRCTGNLAIVSALGGAVVYGSLTQCLISPEHAGIILGDHAGTNFGAMLRRSSGDYEIIQKIYDPMFADAANWYIDEGAVTGGLATFHPVLEDYLIESSAAPMTVVPGDTYLLRWKRPVADDQVNAITASIGGVSSAPLGIGQDIPGLPGMFECEITAANSTGPKLGCTGGALVSMFTVYRKIIVAGAGGDTGIPLGDPGTVTIPTYYYTVTGTTPDKITEVFIKFPNGTSISVGSTVE